MLPPALQLSPASKWQRGFLLLTHAVALLNAWWLAWPSALLMSCLVALSLCWQWRQRPKIQLIQCLPDGVLEVQMLKGEKVAMNLMASSVLTAHVLVLHLCGEGIKLYVVVWPDSADAEVLRQWRIYLRWIWPSYLREKESEIP